MKTYSIVLAAAVLTLVAGCQSAAPVRTAHAPQQWDSRAEASPRSLAQVPSADTQGFTRF